jgi:hypothetical protein
MMQSPSYRAIILALFCFACNQPQPGPYGLVTGISKPLTGSITVGTYSGHYSKGLLTLAINYISGNIASGYDIHKGLRRNLNGSVEQKGGVLEFVLKEPGGNPYDGTFYLSLDTATDKISGKWIPSDASMAKGGPLELVRSTYEHAEITQDLWESDLGTLNFLAEGVCTLEYYPRKDSIGKRDPNAQLVTVRGSYEITGDTIRIDWQRNNRTPTLNMKLIMHAGEDQTDSTGPVAPSLEGKGIKFNKNNAG